MPQDYLLKVVIYGPPGVGKSSLLDQFCEGIFNSEHEQTSGIEFGTYITEISGKSVKLQIWDLAGLDISITSSYFRGAHVALLCYDITQRSTFDYLEGWLKDLREKSDPNIVISLVGMKLDLDHLRAVPTLEGEEFAGAHELLFKEASAKTAKNVETVFLTTARIAINNVQNGLYPETDFDFSRNVSSDLLANNSPKPLIEQGDLKDKQKVKKLKQDYRDNGGQ